MHIALVNRWYPPHTGYGGVAVYNYYLAHALVKLGHQVTVVAARWSLDVPELDDDNGVTVHRLFTKDYYYWQRLPGFGRYARSIHQLLYSRRVAHALRQMKQPDVIEFAEINAEGFFYLRHPIRAKVVVRCHTPTFVLRDYYRPDEMSYSTTLTAAMEKSCIRRADALTTPSHDMVQTIARTCNIPLKRIIPIPNALDTELFAPAAKDKEQGRKGELIILHVGRLDRTKGIEVLAQAIPQVLKVVPNARFVFVGDDRPAGQGTTWQTRLERYFQKFGVNEQVTFTGGVSQAELINWYGQADIAVVPSMLYESFSYTCAQAMAAGLPVVATRIGGVPETVGDCGLIVPVGQVGALVEALGKLIRQPELRIDLGQRAFQRAREYCEASMVAGRMAVIYQGI